MNQQETTMSKQLEGLFMNSEIFTKNKILTDNTVNEISKKSETLPELKKNETLTEKNETLIEKSETLTEKNETPKKSETLTEKNQTLIEKNETLTEKNETPKKNETLTSEPSKKIILTSTFSMDNKGPKKMETGEPSQKVILTVPKKTETLTGEPSKKVILTSKLAMNDKVMTTISVTSELGTKKSTATSQNIKNMEDNNSFRSFDDRIDMYSMPSIIGFITMSFNEHIPYEYTITTLTHYISGKCDSENRWLLNLDYYINQLQITVLYVAGPSQKELISNYIYNAQIEYIYSKFQFPPRRTCPKCARMGCSIFKATNILCYNFGYYFTIPCIY